jgi:hypothetical protein
LAVLIEKDWCAFGHKFQDRAGHGVDGSHLPEERSPIFIQFLSTLYQIMVQFPNSFEYNETLLIFLADHSHSCLFGNFLGNSMKERTQVLKVKEKTKSIWEFVLINQSKFLNNQYEYNSVPIWPSTSMKNIQIWVRYFERWDPLMHPNKECNLSTEWLDYW